MRSYAGRTWNRSSSTRRSATASSGWTWRIAHTPAQDPQRPLRVPDAPRGGRGAAEHTGWVETQGQSVRALRRGLVWLLDEEITGEPKDSRVRGERRDRKHRERCQTVTYLGEELWDSSRIRTKNTSTGPTKRTSRSCAPP